MVSARAPLRHPNYAVAAIVLAYVSLALLYGFITPIFEGPDEIGHVLYVKHLAEGRGIPRQSPEYAKAYGFGQEGSQSPLYYLLNAGLVRGLGLSLSDVSGLPESNPFTTCGRPNGTQNVAGYRHDPRLETFPYAGAARAVHVMRVFSVLLGAATVVAVYLTAHFAFPGDHYPAVLAAALVGLNPQFILMGGVVNNDNLVNCLVALAVALTVYCVRNGFTWVRAVALGVLCGLAPLAKLGGLVALAFAGLGLLLPIIKQVRQDRTAALRLIGKGAALLAAFGVASGWWFVRNLSLYGDPTGTNVMLSVYGGRGGWPAQLIVPELIETFRSYWGVLACGLRFPPQVYWIFAALVLLGSVGWLRGWRRASTSSREIAVLLLVWLIIVAGMWAYWNTITFAPLGRLLFQANAAIGPLLGYGLARLTRRPKWVAVGVGAVLLSLSLAAGLAIMAPAFALPERYAPRDRPQPTRPLPDAVFGDEIQVLGYDLSSSSQEPGETLDVTLHLQALRPIDSDYVLALQLVSPEPGGEEVLVNFNSYPGSGAYGTSSWHVDEVIVDQYQLRIPEQVERAQAWRLMAIFYRKQDGKRLPVSVSGQAAGDALGLELVRVGASTPTEVPAQAALTPPPIFGESISLLGARADWTGNSGGQDRQLVVRLWWEATDALPSDLTVLVHLVGQDGVLAGAGDGPPLEGAFPTSMWLPGDRVADSHTVAPRSDLAPGEYEVHVGWYDPVSGVRLPVTVEGRGSPDGIVTAATLTVE